MKAYRCKFANFNNNETCQKCQITDGKCVFGFGFADGHQCYVDYKIYPEYTYYIDQLNNMNNSNHIFLKDKLIIKNRCDEFSIDTKGKYNKSEVLKIIFEADK